MVSVMDVQKRSFSVMDQLYWKNTTDPSHYRYVMDQFFSFLEDRNSAMDQLFCPAKI